MHPVRAVTALGLGLFAFPVVSRGHLNARVTRGGIEAPRPESILAQLVMVLRLFRFLLQFSNLRLELLYIGFQ